jgi:hypothetical protein
MADLDASAFSAALKEYYDEAKLTDLTAMQSPMLGMLRKGKFLGRGVPIPMVSDPGQASMSGTFSVANTNRAGATYQRFLLEDPGRIYAIGGIDRDVIDLASTPRAAFESVQVEVDAKLTFTAKELAHTAFRSENGLCGKIASWVEGGGKTTIVVEDLADITNLGVGARLVASATEAGALRDSGAVYPIESITYSTGTIVLTGTTNATSSWVNGDYLHRAGSAPNGGSVIYPSGLQDWIKGSGVSATAFRGVNRSANPELLAGTVVAIGSSTIREAIGELAAMLMSRGGMPDVFWVHPRRFQEIEQELDSLASHEKVTPSNVTATIGYNAIRLAAGNGAIRIMSDPMCPYTKGFMLTMSTWSFLEIGGKRQPRLRDMHGGQFLQLQDADAVKFQAEAKGDLACSNPGANGILTF